MSFDNHIGRFALAQGVRSATVAASLALGVILAGVGCGDDDSRSAAVPRGEPEVSPPAAGPVHEFAVEVTAADVGTARAFDLGVLTGEASASIVLRISNHCGSAMLANEAATTCACLRVQSGGRIEDGTSGEVRLSMTMPLGVSTDRSEKLMVPTEGGVVMPIEFRAIHDGMRWLCIDQPQVIDDAGCLLLRMLALGDDCPKPASMCMYISAGDAQWLEVPGLEEVRQIKVSGQGERLSVWSQSFRIDRQTSASAANGALSVMLRANGWSDRVLRVGVDLTESQHVQQQNRGRAQLQTKED